jgi:predicted nucleic acid-binding Zn ribbon protein
MGDVLSELMSRRGYAQVQSIAGCAGAWQDAAGTHFARHSRAGHVRRGVLEVIVRNSAVLQELSFQKKQIVQRLAELAPERRIRDVRFRVGEID